MRKVIDVTEKQLVSSGETSKMSKLFIVISRNLPSRPISTHIPGDGKLINPDCIESYKKLTQTIVKERSHKNTFKSDRLLLRAHLAYKLPENKRSHSSLKTPRKSRSARLDSAANNLSLWNPPQKP